MAKPKDTVEPMCENNQQQGCLEELKKSPLFYLSAGSKELFHSDFLYWLATQHWEIFIRVMRVLAGLKVDEPFWWEECATFDARNLKVMREQSHFDLSVYHRFEAEKWVPVLVLENKVKSLPYVDQLVEYSAEAEKKWAHIENNGKGINNNGKDLMTFILLSLTDAISLYNDSKLKLWTFRNYADLANTLDNNLKHLKGYPKQLCEDYCHFIHAISELANTWKVNTSDSYLPRLCPQAIKDKDKNLLDDKGKELFEKTYKEYTNLSELRMNDIWQKVSFDELRNLLEEELSKAGIRFSCFSRDKNGMTPGFYLATGYTNDTGLIELRYVLNNHPFKKDPVSILIQIQGKQYRYAVTSDNIVAGNKRVYPKWNSLKDTIKPEKISTIRNWITSKSNAGRNDWCRFGDTFIYRYKTIDSKKNVKDILDEIVKDALDIKNTFGV